MQYKMVELRRGWQDLSERTRRVNQIIAQKWNEISDSLELQTRDVRNAMNERMRRTQMYMDGVSQNIRTKMAGKLFPSIHFVIFCRNLFFVNFNF